MIIGICGKSGSGKSTLSNFITEKYDNAIHLDIDKVGHKVLTKREVIEELKICFGNCITINDSIDRKKLGELVFTSHKKMRKLTDITWKYMQIEIDEFLVENKSKLIILDWLLLPKSKYFEMCDVKILLDIPCEIRKERVMKRDNITEKDFELRENATYNADENLFDYVIKSSDIEEIKRLVNKL